MKCVKTKSDLRASVCLWCEGKEIARAACDELETQGFDVVAGICPPCIAKFHADSLKGSQWELRLG